MDSVFNYMYIVPCIFAEFLVFESIKCQNLVHYVLFHLHNTTNPDVSAQG